MGGFLHRKEGGAQEVRCEEEGCLSETQFHIVIGIGRGFLHRRQGGGIMVRPTLT